MVDRITFLRNIGRGISDAKNTKTMFGLSLLNNGGDVEYIPNFIETYGTKDGCPSVIAQAIYKPELRKSTKNKDKMILLEKYAEKLEPRNSVAIGIPNASLSFLPFNPLDERALEEFEDMVTGNKINASYYLRANGRDGEIFSFCYHTDKIAPRNWSLNLKDGKVYDQSELQFIERSVGSLSNAVSWLSQVNGLRVCPIRFDSQ
jgi:hypothetical protein